MHMTKLRARQAIGLGLCGGLLVVPTVGAQMEPPAANQPDGAIFFKQQCATCHTTNLPPVQSRDPRRHHRLP
jgi:cytochrome c